MQMDFSKQEKEVKDFGVNWTPTIVFLDKDGKEHYRFTGFYGPDEYKAQLGLARGKTLFDLEQFDPAIQCFQELGNLFPRSDAAPEARFYLGVAQYKSSKDPHPLKEALEELKKSYPDSQWAKRAAPYEAIP